jgi:hypothetical protein
VGGFLGWPDGGQGLGYAGVAGTTGVAGATGTTGVAGATGTTGQNQLQVDGGRLGPVGPGMGVECGPQYRAGCGANAPSTSPMRPA